MVDKPCDSSKQTSMRDFVLVTHTRWQEAPRIRHQLARLIADSGHRVIFVERPTHMLAGRPGRARNVASNIVAVGTRHLMHHQLRVVPALERLNALVAMRGLRRALQQLEPDADATIINMTHDGGFLRRMFPHRRIVTIIHDDFESMAHLPAFGHVTRSLRTTCLASDQVLAVSTPLVERLREWCEPELFLPWATRNYRMPRPGVEGRNTLLFWGHVDAALDTDWIRSMSARLLVRAPAIRLLFVGPTQNPKRRSRITDALQDLRNVEVKGRTELEDLPLDRVLAALIPYRRKGHVDATELPNKTLPLLSCGLPILKTGLPNMISAPFILPVDTADLLDQAIEACRKNFEGWQSDIREFLAGYQPAARLKALRIDPAP